MKNEHSTHILQSKLEEYVSQGLYPFHMPGHKRRMAPAPGLPFGCDVTELPGTDDLHDAQGILLEAMQRTAALWGADRTWYLVNGSTCGLLAGIRALARRGSEVLCARNCHKAVYHALALAGYRVRWIFPPVDPDLGICGGISAAQVQEALRRHPLAQAVILTSPTYEGVLSRIRGICEVSHARNIPVLVDEAHGAHLLPLSEKAGFPAGALACGADVVVQSPHKTLPSLTQTAFLHLQGDRVDPSRIEEELDIFETSSPSYPLLAALDGCTGILREQGEALFAEWARRIGRFDAAVRELQRIRIPGHTGPDVFSLSEPAGTGAVDPGKILIDARAAGLAGRELAALLRERYRMETEMSNDVFALVMTSICDEEDALDRLAAALFRLDAQTADAQPSGTWEHSVQAADAQPLTAQPPDALPPDAQPLSAQPPDTRARSAQTADRAFRPPGNREGSGISASLAGLRPKAACSIADAAAQSSGEVPLSDAAGRICAEYLYFYPPGIPFLVPGEIITEKHCGLLLRARQEGMLLYRKTMRAGIRCLRE